MPKDWYKSKTVWASIVAFSATIAGVFGVKIAPEEQATLIEGISGATGAAALVVAIIGRRNAKGPLK